MKRINWFSNGLIAAMDLLLKILKNKVKRVKNILSYFVLTFLMVSSLFSSLSNANFNKGMDFYEAKEFEDAFYTFKNMAVIGNKKSQFNLGVMYYKGEFIKKDVPMAYAWMMVAADSGNENFSNVASKIASKMNEKTKSAADRVFSDLSAKYGARVISSYLEPDPLSDEECDPGLKIKKMPKTRFPREAYKGSQYSIGYVDFSLTVSSQGYSRDILVREKTDDIFVGPSLDSVQFARWETEDSQEITSTVRDVRYKTKFLPDESGGRVVAKRFKKSRKAALKEANAGDKDKIYNYAEIMSLEKSLTSEKKNEELDYQNINHWYVKAAKLGHVRAQYELGKNMFTGRGCEVDKEGGLKWLAAAASSGHPFAQEELAMSAVELGLSEQYQADYWLRRAATAEYFPAKLYLAWQLVTTNDSSELDSREALNLLRSEPTLYYDEVRILETKAAVYAGKYDFENAVIWQQKAIDAAKKLKWKIPVMLVRLNSYEKNERWLGPYHI